MGRHLETYAERAAKHTNLAAVKLLDVIDRKKSNLCVSVDVTKVHDFMEIIDVVGPYVSLVKVQICILAGDSPCGLIFISDPRRHP